MILKILYSPPAWFVAILVTILIVIKTRGLTYKVSKTDSAGLQIIHQLEIILVIVLCFCTMERVYTAFLGVAPKGTASDFYIMLAVLIVSTLLSAIVVLIGMKVLRK